MNEKLSAILEDYEKFKKGEKSAFGMIDEVQIALEEARKKGDEKALAQLKDILMDLMFSIDENKCNCSRTCSSC